MTDNSFSYNEATDRNIGFISRKEQDRLLNSCAAVFGVGGHGGVASQLLARSGIGRMRISDVDTFEPSNLNRQVYCYCSTLNQHKADVAEKFLKDINPELKLEKFKDSNEESVNRMLDGADVVLMCIDKVIPSIHVSRICRQKKIPMIETGAMPYANLRVYTDKTPTFEEFHDFPTQDKSIEELYSLSEKEISKLTLQLFNTYNGVEGIMKFYGATAISRIISKKFPTFAPLIWMQASMIALEAIKAILKRGKLSLVPDYALYDPFEHKMPRRK